MSVRSSAARIVKAAKSIGCDIDREQTAQTGTIYLTISAPCGDAVRIRVANHSDAYGTADYTADGMEGTDAGAVSFLKSWLAEQCAENEDTKSAVDSFLAKVANIKSQQREIRLLVKQYQSLRGDYLLIETGEKWHHVSHCIDDAKCDNVYRLEATIVRLKSQIEKAKVTA